jgi:hypothetical protein
MDLFSRLPVQRYTVRETSPCINYGYPKQPLYWHWSIEARSEREAETLIRNAKTGGLDQRVVPLWDKPGRAF